MARFALAFALAAVMVAAASAQFDYFGGFPGGLSAPRDPRQNRGPVTFPVTQPGSETSGVRVGASGYGFVPPGQRGGATIKSRLLPGEGEEEDWMTMARYQLAKMTEEERLGGLMIDGMLATESKSLMTDVDQDGFQQHLERSMAEAAALADRSMKEAERRLLLLMEKWNFGKKKQPY